MKWSTLSSRGQSWRSDDDEVRFGCQFGLSGNVLVSIDVVTLYQAWLVPLWATIFGRINHLGAEPGTYVYSVWTIHAWAPSENWESKQTLYDTLANICGLAVSAGVWLRD